ncbi:MAG: PilN domain-containing protein, partial [Candidatus Omnitrophica bacterium]|nr:PilN domain-containing protein [Candidatus Omnitrophota bacterium]
RMIFLIVGICFIGVFILAAVQMFLSSQMLKWDIRTVEKKLGKVKRVSENLKVMDKNQGKIKQLSQQIDDLLKVRPDFAVPLKDMAKALPEEIVLSKCVLTANKIELEGSVFADYEEASQSIADFKKKLAKTGFFSNVAVPTIELEEISPELSSGGGEEGLRLTQGKNREFKLSAEIVNVPKTAVVETNPPGAKETKTEMPEKVAGSNDSISDYKPTSDAANAKPVFGKNRPILSADKTGRKVKKRKLE